MPKQKVFETIKDSHNRGKKLLAVLIDPEKCYGDALQKFLECVSEAQPDLIFVGGSQMRSSVDDCVLRIKQKVDIPTVLFLGDCSQFSSNADSILILSLISGRNPEFLIGQHIKSASTIKKSGIETIPTGYVLVKSGRQTNVEKYSQTKALSNHSEIIDTVLAGEMLGMKMIYLEAGSGAEKSIEYDIIKTVRSQCEVPLIVGGGIRSIEAMISAYKAGADIVVIGNYFEENPQAIVEFVKKKNTF